MVCSKCKSHKIHRIQREGFFRIKLAPFFGYFPWQCSTCDKVQMLKARGSKRRRSHREEDSLEGSFGQTVHSSQRSTVSFS